MTLYPLTIKDEISTFYQQWKYSIRTAHSRLIAHHGTDLESFKMISNRTGRLHAVVKCLPKTPVYNWATRHWNVMESSLHYGCTAANWRHVYCAAISVQGQKDQCFLHLIHRMSYGSKRCPNFNWQRVTREVIDWHKYIHLSCRHWFDRGSFSYFTLSIKLNWKKATSYSQGIYFYTTRECNIELPDSFVLIFHGFFFKTNLQILRQLWNVSILMWNSDCACNPSLEGQLGR